MYSPNFPSMFSKSIFFLISRYISVRPLKITHIEKNIRVDVGPISSLKKIALDWYRYDVVPSRFGISGISGCLIWVHEKDYLTLVLLNRARQSVYTNKSISQRRYILTHFGSNWFLGRGKLDLRNLGAFNKLVIIFNLELDGNGKTMTY